MLQGGKNATWAKQSDGRASWIAAVIATGIAALVTLILSPYIKRVLAQEEEASRVHAIEEGAKQDAPGAHHKVNKTGHCPTVDAAGLQALILQLYSSHSAGAIWCAQQRLPMQQPGFETPKIVSCLQFPRMTAQSPATARRLAACQHQPKCLPQLAAVLAGWFSRLDTKSGTTRSPTT